MPTYLPNTSLTSMSIGSKIFSYAQDYHGALMEAEGRLVSTKKYSNVYSRGNQAIIGITARWRDEDGENILQDKAPKMFTPLATASIGQTRWLIYVTDDNILHDVVFKDGEWQEGTLSSLQQPDGQVGIRCAPYSKLAAATVNIGGKDIICVYYQTIGQHGPVTMISFVPGNSWTTRLADILDFINALKAYEDPPLYGTSLTAVKPRNGIVIPQEEEQNMHLPVVYLQWDTHALAHAQGNEIRPIPGLEKFMLSPHTSLTVVDDGYNLYCFYIANDNVVRMIRIEEGKATKVVEKVATPTPRSGIAAVMPLEYQDRIVLFYQVWDAGKAEKVDIKAKTFHKKGANEWEALTETNLMNG